MKTILSLLFALTLGTAFGQFIPQPMGYNPDVNGDEFIGVDDVMGTLALYDNAFDNGDSTVTVHLTVSEDNGLYSIPESADVAYITADGPENSSFNLILPSGDGFKSLVIFVKNIDGIDGSQASLNFLRSADCLSEGSCYMTTMGVSENLPQYTIVMRGPDGVWYHESNY